jgi:hypothetical protein
VRVVRDVRIFAISIHFAIVSSECPALLLLEGAGKGDASFAVCFLRFCFRAHDSGCSTGCRFESVLPPAVELSGKSVDLRVCIDGRPRKRRVGSVHVLLTASCVRGAVCSGVVLGAADPQR